MRAKLRSWSYDSVETRGRMEKIEPASLFYRHKEGRCTCTGGGRSRRFSPNQGRTVNNYCRKYTARYGVWRGSHSRRHPWPCGDRAGVLVAPAGSVVVAIGGTVLQAWRGDVLRVLQARVLPRSKPEPPLEGRAHAVQGLRGGESLKEVWRVGSTVAGAVLSVVFYRMGRPPR